MNDTSDRGSIMPKRMMKTQSQPLKTKEPFLQSTVYSRISRFVTSDRGLKAHLNGAGPLTMIPTNKQTKQTAEKSGTHRMAFPTYSCEIGIGFLFSSVAGITSNTLRTFAAARKRFPLARYRPGQILWPWVNSLAGWMDKPIPSTVSPLSRWWGYTWF